MRELDYINLLDEKCQELMREAEQYNLKLYFQPYATYDVTEPKYGDTYELFKHGNFQIAVERALDTEISTYGAFCKELGDFIDIPSSERDTLLFDISSAKIDRFFTKEDFVKLKAMFVFKTIIAPEILKDVLDKNGNSPALIPSEDFKFDLHYINNTYSEKLGKFANEFSISISYKDKVVAKFEPTSRDNGEFIYHTSDLIDSFIKAVNEAYKEKGLNTRFEIMPQDVSHDDMHYFRLGATDLGYKRYEADSYVGVFSNKDKILLTDEYGVGSSSAEVKFDGRLYDFKAPDGYKYLTDWAVEKCGKDEVEAHEEFQAVFEMMLDDFWLNNPQGQMDEFLKAENLDDKLAVFHRKGKDFWIVPTLDENKIIETGADLYDNCGIWGFAELTKPTQEEYDKVYNFLKDMKQNLCDSISDEFIYRIEESLDKEDKQEKTTRRKNVTH